MSIQNEDEFKLRQNGKNYSVIIGIEEDQLSLVLVLYSNPPKKYSGFFSLNELRISSKIFNHTETLFEAKEIIKRTVIKKQLQIDENDLRANITFDTGLGHDSVPFPITLFRDASEKQVNNAPLNNIGNPRDNTKKSKIIKNGNNIINNNANNNNINYNNLNKNNIKENNNDKKSTHTNNTKILRASIGNNVNNKMLNQSQIINKNNQIDNITIGNIQFNNSMKRGNNDGNRLNNGNGNNLNNDINSKNNNGKSYKKVDFINNNVNNNVNNNNVKGNRVKDYVELNNNLLHNIYNNMNNNNNVNSSFYRNLQNSFIQTNNNENNINNNDINPNVYNNINNNNLRQNIRNIDNNSMNQTHLQQNLNMPYNNINNQPQLNINNNVNNLQQLNINKNINNQAQIPLNNNNKNNLNYGKLNNNLLNQNNIPNKIPPQYKQIQQQQNKQFANNMNQNPNLNNNLMNPALIANNQSFATAPIQKNFTKIPNIDNNMFLNKSINFENNKNKTVINNNDNKLLTSSSSEEEDNIEEENIEESSQGEQPYRFKNLILKGTKKIKGNLEKFKENQNIGDYVPSGTKFVSYLKFPETKNITNQSITASTISSSLTSGSNRIVGIEKNIIKNPSELEEITARIQHILRKRNVRYKLLYKASVDGDISSKFHEKCDKIPNTLILIKASLDKRFGGFTTQTWDGEDINKIDNNCFIFSIDKAKIYDINEAQEAINCNPDLGPVFINQIKLLDKFFIQGGTTNKKGKTFSTLEDFEITGGAEKFGVKEVEVYQVK